MPKFQFSSDQRILFFIVWESFMCCLANSMQAFICLALRRGFRRATLPKAPAGGGLQWWLTLWNFLPSPYCISGAQPQWSLGSSLPLSPRLFSHTCSVWLDARSRKSSGRPKLLPFKDYGGHCALRNLECCRNYFVTLARSVACHNSTSWFSFALACTVSCKVLYRQVCAFPNQVQSVYFNTARLQWRSRLISRRIRRNGQHVSEIWAKGLNTYDHVIFQFLF